ncbi:DUF389 domain-containing protein [uncultured Jatrophihabitans sp.]|uniref:DUF389 domain-containing protein n=1 Tax=uncultured Jatrophihabitans sp. TaxID=1610747 RepID=UPI0035CA1E14
MIHLRVVCPQHKARAVQDALSAATGVVAVRAGVDTSDGQEITADLARESAGSVLATLHHLDVGTDGLITIEPLDTALGMLADRAEREAPGEGADAVIWDELAARTGEDSTLTWTFLAFLVLATLLASIGVVTDSPITIVGAMVVGPEFGPLAGLAVGILRRRADAVRRALLALLVGFPVALVVCSLLALLARAVGLIHAGDITGSGRQTEFIYHPGWFSLITALVAGTAGMLSLTSSKSAALVGVFISVTTVPAAGNAAVAGVLGQWRETWLSLAQLGINLVGIVAAGVLTLAALRAGQAADDRVLRR